jgi:diguanylate cyclase (GGDEF)-like protein
MPVRRGLPSPSISIKLYGIVALFLAMICALAAATTHFAIETESAVSSFQREGLGNVALTAQVQVLLEQHRRMVATAPFVSPDAGAQDERIYSELNATIAGLIDRIAPDRAEKLSQRFALLASQGSSVFELARHEHRDQAIAVGVRYASAADGLTLEMLTEARRHLTDAQGNLQTLAAHALSLAMWIGAAAVVTGLAIGPFCLLLLHRMLARMRGIGSSLIRLARNDTSVEIPGTTDADEFGQLARSVAVFKAKSIELLNKKADFERVNLQLDAAINTMPLGLSMFDAHERLLMCNRQFADMYDVPPELARPGTARCALREYRTRKGARHSESGELSIGGANLPSSVLIEFGSDRVIEVSRQPLKGGGWVSLHEDITARRRQEEKIAHLAHHDTLTGLANRMLFRQRLEQNLQRLGRGQGFAVLCLDLDHFKAVNDTLGHPVGDVLLKQVSQRLLDCVRHGDIVARLGGDEFAIVQASVRDPGQTEALAARIVEAVSAPYAIDGNRIDIGTSIGITLAPRDGSDADKLMKNADLALYRSKGAGRRRFSFFEPQMHEAIQARRSLEFDLRRALGEDALELHYQPTIRLASEQATGFEALLRWNHPERGPIPPGEFLAIAEDIGLAAQIGGWALRQACAQAARWPEPIHVAIDVSSLQFLKRNLTESVLQALAQSGLPPHRLELEIAESILHEDANTLSILRQLRQLGVGVTLDGFGSGRCSLTGLRAFPFDKIKIDKAFVADIERSKEARAIVEATIALGSRLNMTTAAEGIEDFDQLALLRSWGCRDGQGFLLGPPMPAGEVDGFLHARLPTPRAPLSPEFDETVALPESSQAA